MKTGRRSGPAGTCAELRSYARRTSVTDRWVAQVGQAFEAADRLGVR